jgi:septum formation protein
MMTVPRVSFRVPLVLASSSPRRAELLTRAGIAFIVRAPDADEAIHRGELPEDYAVRVATAKATAGGPSGPDTIILAADTIVVSVNTAEVLGKPKSDADAARMLTLLSGQTHLVMTGVAVAAYGRAVETELAISRVTFHPLMPEEIAWYVATGEPRDKAGAYAIQGFASRFVSKVDGSYSNVVGLPLDLVYRRLRALDPSLVGAPAGAR